MPAPAIYKNKPSHNRRLIQYFYLPAFAAVRFAFGAFIVPGKLFASIAHIVGAKNTDKYVPASRPKMIGNAKI